MTPRTWMWCVARQFFHASTTAGSASVGSRFAVDVRDKQISDRRAWALSLPSRDRRPSCVQLSASATVAISLPASIPARCGLSVITAPPPAAFVCVYQKHDDWASGHNRRNQHDVWLWWYQQLTQPDASSHGLAICSISASYQLRNRMGKTGDDRQ